MYKWESEDERLLRFMRISPQKKMEWLLEMQEFSYSCSSKRQLEIRRKLKENRK